MKVILAARILGIFFAFAFLQKKYVYVFHQIAE